MNGSTKQVARGEQAPSAEARPQAGATARVAVAASLWAAKAGQCTMCGKVGQHQTECQNIAAIHLFLMNLKLYDWASSVQPGALLCKDCCIGLVNGHKCPWWDLCWNI